MRAEEELNAALRLVDLQHRFAARGVGLAQAAMAGRRRLVPYEHCPRRDVVDAARGESFYYHAHPSRRCPEAEHGHFHLFRHDAGGGFFHLAGLSLDARGWPIRWFTTNRWVTGERWAPAAAVLDALSRFAPVAAGRLAPVAQWLAAMVQMDLDRLAALVRRRDAVVTRRIGTGFAAGADGVPTGPAAEALFEDRRLDVITETRIALPERLARLAGSPITAPATPPS